MAAKPKYIMTATDVLYGTDHLSKEWNHPAEFIGKYNKKTGKVKPVKDPIDTHSVDVIGSKKTLLAINRQEAKYSGISLSEMNKYNVIKPIHAKKPKKTLENSVREVH